MTALNVPSRRRLPAHADTPSEGSHAVGSCSDRVAAIHDRIGSVEGAMERLSEEFVELSDRIAETNRLQAQAVEYLGRIDARGLAREEQDALDRRRREAAETAAVEAEAVADKKAAEARGRIWDALGSKWIASSMAAILASVLTVVASRLGVQTPQPVIQISSEPTPSLDERDQQPHAAPAPIPAAMPPQEPSPSPGALGE